MKTRPAHHHILPRVRQDDARTLTRATQAPSQPSPRSNAMHHATVGLVEVEVALGDQARELIHHIRQRDGSLRIADVRALEHRTGQAASTSTRYSRSNCSSRPAGSCRPVNSLSRGNASAKVDVRFCVSSLRHGGPLLVRSGAHSGPRAPVAAPRPAPKPFRAARPEARHPQAARHPEVGRFATPWPLVAKTQIATWS